MLHEQAINLTHHKQERQTTFILQRDLDFHSTNQNP